MKSRDDALFWVRLTLLGAFLLNVPTISSAALVAGAALVLASPQRARLLSAGPALRIALLATFCITYYIQCVGYHFVSFSQAIRHAALIVLAYVLGTASGAERSDRDEQWSVLVACFVTALYSGLCVASAGASLAAPELEDRAARHVWATVEQINGPALGAMASLGASLVAVAVLGLPARRLRASWLVWATSVAACIVGVAVNVSLQNRGPLLAAAISLGCGLLVLFRSMPARSLLVRASLAVALGLGVWKFASSHDDLRLIQRFEQQGLESARYRVWAEALAGIAQAPMGGRVTILDGETYAHNLWLDVGFDSGVVPLVLLLGFHLAHWPAIVHRLRVAPPQHRLLSTAALTAALLTYLTEPALQLSITYFATTCFILGACSAPTTLTITGTTHPNTPMRPGLLRRRTAAVSHATGVRRPD